MFLLACATDPVDSGSSSGSGEATSTYVVTDTPVSMGAEADAAIALVPEAFRGGFALALARVDDERRDELARLVLDLDDPALLDEIAFSVAHLSPDVLDSNKFYPTLLLENARGIYAVDPYLDYVELIDVETPEGRLTTTRYLVEVDGVIQTYELDPWMYYWYIVHPRIEDENPWYVAPWEECSRNDLECHEDPSTGTFWRTFLWDGVLADCPEGRTCSALVDYLPGTPVLWGAADGNDAVHAVAGMMLDSPGGSRWFTFGAYGERSIQPVRIYGLGRGNCGEWGDMTTALSRTALIPNVNVTPSSWDHTWNAFWLDRWVAWEPVNWWFDHPYGSGYATYATRGDTTQWYQTDQYTSSVATLEVEVVDAAGLPVDGAAVTIWTPYDAYWWYAGEQSTGHDGVATFVVGADKQVGTLVASELGYFPSESSLSLATEGIAAGQHERLRVQLEGAMPTTPVASGTDEAEAPTRRLHFGGAFAGQLAAPSWIHEDLGTQADTPSLTWRVLTTEAYGDFATGAPYEVLYEGPAGAVDVDDGLALVVVLANEGRLVTAAYGEAHLSLSTPAEGREEPLASDFVYLLPGEHVVWPLSWSEG